MPRARPAPRTAVLIPIRGGGAANILDADAMARLEVAILAAERDGASAAVLHGPPGRFAAGADLGALESLDGPGAHEFARLGSRLFRRMEASRLWMIAAVDGHCIGGGFDVALACDLILAAPGATFRHPGARIGFPTAYGGNRRLPRRVGRGRAAEILLGGRTLAAPEAVDLGLVAELVPPDQLCERALRRASEWVVRPTLRPFLQEVMRGTGQLSLAAGISRERAASRLYHAATWR